MSIYNSTALCNTAITITSIDGRKLACAHQNRTLLKSWIFADLVTYVHATKLVHMAAHKLHCWIINSAMLLK